MAASSSYQPIVAYYDLSQAALVDDIPFVLAQAEKISGEILELGCGTGRLLIPLALAGHIVTGIDAAPGMLARTQEKIKTLPKDAGRRMHLVEADMTAFNLEKLFDLIFISHNTSMHLTENQLFNCLRQIHNHLSPMGRWLIDVANPFTLLSMEDQPEPQFEQTLAGDLPNGPVEQYATYRLDPKTQTLHLTWHFRPANGPETALSSRYHIRFPHQFELACLNAGLRVRNFYGGYDSKPYTENGERLIILGDAP